MQSHRYALNRYGSSRLLTPPREEEEVYPFRPIWPSVVTQLVIIFATALTLTVMTSFFEISVPRPWRQPSNIALALLPGLLWILLSRVRERTVPQPRRGLLGVFVISMLVANAIGTPAIIAIAPAEWLSLSGTFRRILGFAVTIGIIEEILKYLVIRYTVWPDRLRIRLDAVAYTNAAAYGYVTALNMSLALNTSLSTEVMAGRVFSNTAIHLAAGMIVAYGMADLRFNPRSLLLMPMALILASLVHGLGITARSGLINAGFVLGVASSRPLFGLALSAVLIGLVGIAIAFLFTNVEREEREAIASRER